MSFSLIAPRSTALIISERPQNVSSCIQGLILENSGLNRIHIISSIRNYKPYVCASVEIIVHSPVASKLCSHLFTLASLGPAIIFCDNALSLLSERVISIICDYPEMFAGCEIRRYAFLPPLSVERNTIDYLCNGLGERSFWGLAKRLLCVLHRKLLGSSFTYLSYPDDRCTYISPDYGRLAVSKPSALCNVFYEPRPSYNSEICFLYGNEPIELLRSELFLEAIAYLCQEFSAAIKLHPRTSAAKLAVLRQLEKRLGHSCIKDNVYWEDRNPSVGIAIASSGLFMLDFKVRISLSKLLYSQCKSTTRNSVHPFVYHKQLSQFYPVTCVHFPNTINEMTSILVQAFCN